ncbi:hypothetical protein BEWA_008840 [Theileria equi strain WA]|uniref:Uncharacterized protein n=1 Tax=Theileria equi strain WA TaxID=1537102 RepID=L0B0U5_THEEQ|nr:hypothetical protein BEWA_008840 [Theileria equi strain WA]AFZ81472.1 hypothetical protein BEWA_008840 [Theileria equi strain WA]|eukprot:XP_004831138.1 hypothetical protein BEWA_008840 [Theileria equi strain WA]
MNFLKGIVDGILSEDVSESANKPKFSRVVDSDDSETPNATESYSHRTKTTHGVFINNVIEQLGHLYQSERDKCLESLVVRYGEGCVQQLSQMLRTNHETILILTQQLENNIAALRDVNRKIESAAVQQLQLRNENDKLQHKIQLLNTENMSLKSQLTQSDITIKSKDSHIARLNEIIYDGKCTFESMKRRCGEFYRYKTEIDELKKKLELAEGHIEMLKQERNQFWNNTSLKVTDEIVKNRIANALERQDKAIAIAKLMASQPLNMGSFFRYTPKRMQTKYRASESDAEDDLQESGQESPKIYNGPLCELKSRVESLEDENAHLKEINDDLHTMYADLSKSCMDIKRNFLQESIDSLTSFLPQRTTPIQLIFVQPTGVLDLEFDTKILSDSSNSLLKQNLAASTSKNTPLQDFTNDNTGVVVDDRKPLAAESRIVSIDEENKRKSAAWDTDWDFFEEVSSQPNVETNKENASGEGEHGDIDRNIGSYESAVSFEDTKAASVDKLEKIDELVQVDSPVGTRLYTDGKFSAETALLVDLGSPVRGNTIDKPSFEGEPSTDDKLPKAEPSKSNSAWDNIDFDDEMFNE